MSLRTLAACAALALFGTCAAHALTIDAATARIRTAGAPMPGGWNLHSNGEVGDFIRLDGGGHYAIGVVCWGSPVQGEWPLLQVRLDGWVLDTFRVDWSEPIGRLAGVSLGAGVHRVEAVFINDALRGDEDRNVYLRSIEVQPGGDSPPPRLADPAEYVAAAERAEDEQVRASAAAILEHRTGDAALVVLGPDGRPAAGAAVTVELARHDFLFGCNIYMFDKFQTPDENAAYRRRFEELFNYATVGFYWRGYEPERGKPDYAYTDKVVAWCRERGIRMKGHPLLWDHPAGIPAWSKGQPGADVQKARVQEIMRRYAGRIEFWEVVNEPAHLKGIPIDEPYRWAREADPKARLIVNDYHVMATGYPPFYELLERARDAGVPFDGIGIQAHEPRTMRFPLVQVRHVLDRYNLLGKDLHITEFTIQTGGQPITGSHRTGRWDEAAQAEYAEKFYRVCFAHPAVAGITWWDLSDRGAWLKTNGMLRADLSPKPVYEALQRLIRTEWRTRVRGETDAAGRFPWRGFYGTYTVRAEADGRAAESEFHLVRGGAREWTVRLPRAP